MKWLMKILGMELVSQTNPDDGIVELTLVPREEVKKKEASLMDIATGGLASIIAEAQSNVQRRFKLYMNLHDWCREFKNQPLSDVWVEITLDRTAMEIATSKKR